MHTLRIATISTLSLLVVVSALAGGVYIAGAAFTGPSSPPPGSDGVIRADSSGNVGINVAPSASFKLYVGGNLGLGTAAKLDFAEDVGDKIYWFTNNYGTGIEGNTLTNWTDSRHRWKVSTSANGCTSVGDTSFCDTVMNLRATGLGILKDNPAYALDVAGDINYTGQLRLNGTPVSFGGSNAWTTGSGLIYPTSTATNVAIGKTTAAQKLDVGGDVTIQNNGRVGLNNDLSGQLRSIKLRSNYTGDQGDAGTIAYRPTWDSEVLAIIGASTGSPRKVRIWDWLGVGKNPTAMLDVNGTIIGTNVQGATYAP